MKKSVNELFHSSNSFSVPSTSQEPLFGFPFGVHISLISTSYIKKFSGNNRAIKSPNLYEADILAHS